MWTVLSSARGPLRRWPVARRNLFEGPVGGYRGRRVLSILPDRSKSSPTIFSRAWSRIKTGGKFNIFSASPEGASATLEPATSDIQTPENFAGESDVKVDGPELLAIEPDKPEGTVTVVSDVAPALQEYDRWAPIMTVKDAERVFNRAKAPGGSYSKEAANYQQQ